MAMALLTLGLAMPAFGQGSDGDAQGKRQELQSLRQSLAAIRQSAMEANPELAERQSQLEDQMMARMRDEGVQPRKDIRRLQDIASELRQGDIDDERREALRTEYQTTREELLEARRTAMNDEQIRESLRVLREQRMAAMSELNADVPWRGQRPLSQADGQASMELTLGTPSLLFPAVSLLLLAYTNRFLALASLIRDLQAQYSTTPRQSLAAQIDNLRRRVRLIQSMQATGVGSLLLCVASMFVLFGGVAGVAGWLFGASLVLMMISLTLSVREIWISVTALNIQLADMESGR
jgi:hypothetical protein